jgi:alcohol dehydrogenase YqhD (iron-dependent ADH family)
MEDTCMLGKIDLNDFLRHERVEYSDVECYEYARLDIMWCGVCILPKQITAGNRRNFAMHDRKMAFVVHSITASFSV